MRLLLAALISACAVSISAPTLAGEARVSIDASRELQRISPLLTGACIEDVNHEIYGGLYSQMIFGESFQEPASSIAGFQALGGGWRVSGDALLGSAGDGPKLVSELPAFADGEVSVDVRFDGDAPGNAGLIVRVASARAGADSFIGYEVSLNPKYQSLVLGRHRNNWELLREVPCEFEIGDWVRLEVKLDGNAIEISVNGASRLRHEDGGGAIASGAVGLRQWQRGACYRNLRVKTSDGERALDFGTSSGEFTAVSGMWRAVKTGSATGEWTVPRGDAFVGEQSQKIAHRGGDGEIGIENRGLNRWGLHFVADNPYEGLLWARAQERVEVVAALESGDGAQVLAEQAVTIEPGDWRRVEFALTPNATISGGRFTLKLKQAGAVTLGYVSLQPGDWGRFQGLPVRRDVAEAMVLQGISILRYGGSMVNNPGYRWKNMIGPRDRRQPYAGHWYPYSTNGWGIVDFMNFCEAANFDYVPTFHMGESPQDMADFIEYAKGDAATEWGKRRVSDGHPEPYNLKYLELGNEERVDLAYAEKFAAMAKEIWARDPEITLIVGDFVYSDPIADPNHFTGAASGITNLEGQKKILELAKAAGREVWFDVHVWTDGPRVDESLEAFFSFEAAMQKVADGAPFKVLTFEFNANSHGQGRALGNALAINMIERNGRIPIATSANGLQPDGQNDNGWDQGLLFLNPEKTWLQPPGYVTQLYKDNYQPRLVACDVSQANAVLDANAKLSEDGATLVLQLVNPSDEATETTIKFTGFAPTAENADVTELAAALNAVNTAEAPDAVKPVCRAWRHGWKQGVGARLTVAPRSVTVIRWQ